MSAEALLYTLSCASTVIQRTQSVRIRLTPEQIDAGSFQVCGVCLVPTELDRLRQRDRSAQLRLGHEGFFNTHIKENQEI
jgi:hypothetical protein